MAEDGEASILSADSGSSILVGVGIRVDTAAMLVASGAKTGFWNVATGV